MANLGAHDVKALNAKFLTPATPVNPPTLFSAFPLIWI